jgi:hypothetical protein
MTKLAIFQGVTTPISDLAKAIQAQGWQLGQVKFDTKLNAFTAEAVSPHGEKLTKTGPDEATAVSNAMLAVSRRNHMRTAAMYKVGMWRTNWHSRPREIAEAYRDAPIYDPKAVAAYKALADDSMHRLHILGGQLHIEPTNDPQPYKSADDMRKDVHEKRHYYLTQAGSAHPVWTSQQVAAFRAVHDILGHGVAGGHYDWPGRVQAAHAHMPLLEPLAQQALFAEAVARPAFLHTYGTGPQKVALFPEFVDNHQSRNQPGYHRGIHPSQTTAPTAVVDPWTGETPDKNVFMNAVALQGKQANWGNTIDANKHWNSGIDPMPLNAYVHHGDPLEYKNTMDNAGLIDTGWSKFQKGDGSDDRERMKLAIVNAFRVVLLSPRKDLRWNAIHYQDIAHIPGGVDDPKVYWDTLENSRRSWNEKQGIDPESHMIYFKFLKPFEARIAANNPEKGWEWAKQEAKQVLFNWWTEEQERISADDSKKPADKQRGADEIERRANEALARRLQLFLKPKDENHDVQDTQMSMFGSIHHKRVSDYDYDALLQRNRESWDQYNDLAGHKGDYVGWVPTDVVARFSEYDRRPGGKHEIHFPGYWDTLREHIRENGFKSPLYLDVNQDKETAHLSEGNHRVQIAQELGLSHVPVIMYRSNRSSAGERPITLDRSQFPEDRFDPTGYRMPDMFHPAIAGLPTREPFPGHKMGHVPKTATFPGPEYLVPGQQYTWWSDESRRWRETGEPRTFNPGPHITYATYIGPHNHANYQRAVPEIPSGHQWNVTQGGYDGMSKMVRATKDDPSDPHAANWEQFHVVNDENMQHIMEHGHLQAFHPPGADSIQGIFDKVEMEKQDQANRWNEAMPTTVPEEWTKQGAGGQYNLLTGEEALKYGAFMGTHLKAIAQISQHADEILDAALADVREHDAEGHHFRHEVLKLGVSGVGPKVCSFAWLLLQPMTSQLATIDTHMMDVLGHDYEKEMNNRDYFKFEREFRAGLDAAGYSHMPLGAGQWGMWDFKRTGPGTHQDHSAMRVLDPKPHPDVDWVGKAVNLKGESWLKQAPDWWQHTAPAREAVAKEWDDTYGKSFAQNQIPYQDLGTARTSMAQHTGDPELDALIEEFKQSECKAHSTAPSLPVDRWRNRDDALGNCNDASLHFAQFLNMRGINAYGTETTRAEENFGEGITTPEWVGYHDRPEKGDSGHEVVIVEKDGKTYSVDWTAAQYGYKEFPMVQLLTPQGWNRSFGQNATVSRTILSYDHPFSYYWDRSMPVGVSLDSKARTLAEHAKADDLSDTEFEEWLEEHQRDTKLSSEAFKRFKNKALKKFDRISKVAAAKLTPSFIHPETMTPHHGMPGQSLMEHARLQTGLSTQDVWRLLADEHVHKG